MEELLVVEIFARFRWFARRRGHRRTGRSSSGSEATNCRTRSARVFCSTE
jgi:hypothetical protein